ncbi:hypothetical protein [Salininema proteolyticum]|uniref:Uncharacterized protein n=1 Tax=Salininema proteolyticum TaxID=1607685 RepID=A0ABV8TYQ2_9ACTN
MPEPTGEPRIPRQREPAAEPRPRGARPAREPDPLTVMAMDSVLSRLDDPEPYRGDPRLPLHAIGEWVLGKLCGPDFLDLADARFASYTGTEPSAVDLHVLQLLAVRPRLGFEIERTGPHAKEEVRASLRALAEAGAVSPLPNPAWREEPSWRLADPILAYRYGFLAENFDRWRRGRVNRLLWLKTRARLHRAVFRPHFYGLARDWLVGRGSGAAPARVVLPDSEQRKLLVLDIATAGDSGEAAALGTGRWQLPLRPHQRGRMAYIAERLGHSGPAYAFHCVPPPEPSSNDIPAAALL